MTRRAALLALLLALTLQPAGSDGDVAADVSKVLQDATAAHDAAVQEDLAGNAGLAARLYRRALQLRPAQWESSLRLGTLQLRMQRQPEAEAALRYTIAIAEQRSGVDLCAARTNLGVLLSSRANAAEPSEAGQRDAAILAAESLSQYEAAAAAGRCNTARLNAARLLQETAERSVPLPAVPNLGQLGEPPQRLRTAAVVHYSVALAAALKQGDAEIADAAAKAYASLRPAGKFSDGVPHPLDARQHAAVGRAALSLGDRKGAKFYTRQALKLAPDSHAAQLNLALLAEQKGAQGESVAAYRRALKLARGGADVKAAAAAANNLGNLLQGMGRLEEALQAYDTTLELRPENAEAWNNRGVALFATQTRFDESVASYARSLDLAPSLVQAFGGMMYVKTFVCDWRDRSAELSTLGDHAASCKQHNEPAENSCSALFKAQLVTGSRCSESARLIWKAELVMKHGTTRWLIADGADRAVGGRAAGPAAAASAGVPAAFAPAARHHRAPRQPAACGPRRPGRCECRGARGECGGGGRQGRSRGPAAAVLLQVILGGNSPFIDTPDA